jgi:hypothetical protein
MPRKTQSATTKKRSTRRITGKGSYDVKTAPVGHYATRIGEAVSRELLPAGTKHLSNYIGKALGFAGHNIARLFGSGEYKIGTAPKYNSLFKGSATPSQLSFGDRNVRMTHREYLGDIISSATAGDFNIQKFEINPGLLTTFPYLSQIARNFQMYRFRGLVFEFVTSSGDGINSTNTSLGTVSMVCEYNVKSDAPRSKREMLNTNGSMSCKPSDNMVVGIECDPNKGNNGQLFVRNHDVTGEVSRDIRFSDLGNLYVSTSGLQGSSVNVGELFVTYDVDFLMPVTEGLGAFDQTTCIRYDGTVNTLPGEWPIPAYNSNPELPGGAIGTQYPIGVYNPIGIVVRYLGGTPATSTMRFPKSCNGGYYNIQITWLGTVATVLAPNATARDGLEIKFTDDAPASFSDDFLSVSYLVYINPDNSIWQPSDIQGVTWPGLDLQDAGIPGGMTTGQIRVYVERINPKLMANCFSL